MAREDEERARRAWTYVGRTKLTQLRARMRARGMSDEEFRVWCEEGWREVCRQNEALIRARHPHLVKYLE